ncbi:hypothetical protein RvY_17430 [Ramazzottius varieornatus]|uniref:Uncharacterized protein n=1 Tax=Ramazzottius varieornatus TaxID=947166 RepID=A0A1D1W7Y3_RAMVA|nr:hypothetical protein RvY_17430 [Ramazzottius varieornatus]
MTIDGLDSIGFMVNAKSTVMDIYKSGEQVVDLREWDIGGGVTMPALTKEVTVVHLGSLPLRITSQWRSAIPKPTEEYVIQQINSAGLLNNSTDEYENEFRKPSQEIERMVASLDTKVNVTERDMFKPRVLGVKLRTENPKPELSTRRGGESHRERFTEGRQVGSDNSRKRQKG